MLPSSSPFTLKILQKYFLLSAHSKESKNIKNMEKKNFTATLPQKPYNFTTNTQKAYLSVQASSLSAFLISKTHISGQKLRGRQLNTKVCGSKSTIFRILSSLRLFSCFSNNDNSKTVQALTLILARNGCSSQYAASQPLSVPIASNSPWPTKAFYNTLRLLSVA